MPSKPFPALALFVILTSTALGGCLASHVGSLPSSAVGRPTPSNLREDSVNLTFVLSKSRFDSGQLDIFAGNLTAGDTLIVLGFFGDVQQTSWVPTGLEEARRVLKPGVNIWGMIVYSQLATLVAAVRNQPDSVGWVGYDYESGPTYSPEFSKDQAQSISYFDVAKDAAAARGFKLMVTPTYNGGATWDWGEVARHMDAMNVQLQSRLRNVPDFKDKSGQVIAQVQQKSPTTSLFIQTQLIPKTGTPEECARSIDVLRGKPLTGALVFLLPENTDQLKEFFGIFRRNAQTA